MESKKEIVNGETVVECKLTRKELVLIYNALNRLYCETDEKRVKTTSPILSELYGEKCDSINSILENIFDIVVE